jgi:hypothetical protein
MTTVFISHSSKDQAVARTVCAALESRGLTCWIACRDVGPGENFQDAIVTAIRSAKVMVLVFSENANNSTEIKKELALASQHRIAVIPARVEDVAPVAALAYELATRQWINLFDDWETEIETLSDRVRKIVAPPRSQDSSQVSSAPSIVSPIVETTARPAAAPTPIAKPPAAPRAIPLWLALTLTIIAVLRLGLAALFMTMAPSWRLTSYLLAGDALTTGFALLVAGILLMVTTARWATATATAVCTVALLHDSAWLSVWYLVHADARIEAVVLHFGPMVACAAACAAVLLFQIWRQTAELRRGFGRQRDLAGSVA